MIQPLPTSDALGFRAWALGFATKTTLSLEDLLPNVATADVRDLGSKQVQEHKVGEAPQVAHAHVCEEAAVQIESCQAGQA